MTTYGQGRPPEPERRAGDGGRRFDYHTDRGSCSTCFCEAPPVRDAGGQLVYTDSGHLVAGPHRKVAIGGGECPGTGSGMSFLRADE